ncbi:DUF1702 family protein [Micromonospora craniellae]|uniref:DUF1702 family protein n=1 Tax=Micromonospora craniellae TaxID=2294034 RepID=A0A372FSN8_9ACTN|nr:DUF1702 family protein [Micromonospora craniellae]QOC91745.1 DUF1702 family protein [Micromonospora craniellae]RFS43765.1 DUF1702 family protein [Micromonospora craniellae]
MTSAADRLRSRITARMELTDERLDRRLALFTPVDDAVGDLVSAIGREFAQGFNDTLRTYDPAVVSARVDAMEDDYLAPFYVEGAAMALAAGGTLYPGRARTAHRSLLTTLPGHRYLIFAGWGWWYAVRPFATRAMRRSPLWRQDGLFTGLGIDGMAFATCFLTATPPRFDAPCPFPEPEYETLWLQGYGRALWFVAGGRPEVFRDQRERLAPRSRPELYAGLGLATAFAGMRRMRCVPEAPSEQEAERRAFFQGLAFGLTARREASPRSFQRFLDHLDAPSAGWVTTVTDRCLQPPERDTSLDGGYVSWQRRLRDELPLPGRSA